MNKKGIRKMMKNTIKMIDETTAQVTKAFAKKAVIFGTDEYKLWKAFKAENPEAQMVTKTIKKNPNKKTNKNMTYENMAAYIKTQENAAEKLKELKTQIQKSKIQNNPYRAVLAWFEQEFKGYDNYKSYFEEQAKAKAAEEDIFSLAG